MLPGTGTTPHTPSNDGGWLGHCLATVTLARLVGVNPHNAPYLPPHNSTPQKYATPHAVFGVVWCGVVWCMSFFFSVCMCLCVCLCACMWVGVKCKPKA